MQNQEKANRPAYESKAQPLPAVGSYGTNGTAHQHTSAYSYISSSIASLQQHLDALFPHSANLLVRVFLDEPIPLCHNCVTRRPGQHGSSVRDQNPRFQAAIPVDHKEGPPATMSYESICSPCRPPTNGPRQLWPWHGGCSHRHTHACHPCAHHRHGLQQTLQQPRQHGGAC